MITDELEKEAEEFTDSKKSFWRQGRTCIDSVKQAYLAGAEPREKRIEELEKQYDIVRNERNLFQERCEDILENYYCDHPCKCAELEKENAELKEKYVKNICDCDICDTYCNSQLIKAKEIIEKVAKMYRYSPRVEEIIEQAEQFLKDSEVEK